MGITFGQVSGLKERMREKGRGEPILNTEISLDLSANILCVFLLLFISSLSSSVASFMKTRVC